MFSRCLSVAPVASGDSASSSHNSENHPHPSLEPEHNTHGPLQNTLDAATPIDLVAAAPLHTVVKRRYSAVDFEFSDLEKIVISLYQQKTLVDRFFYHDAKNAQEFRCYVLFRPDPEVKKSIYDQEGNYNFTETGGPAKHTFFEVVAMQTLPDGFKRVCMTGFTKPSLKDNWGTFVVENPTDYTAREVSVELPVFGFLKFFLHKKSINDMLDVDTEKNREFLEQNLLKLPLTIIDKINSYVEQKPDKSVLLCDSLYMTSNLLLQRASDLPVAFDMEQLRTAYFIQNEHYETALKNTCPFGAQLFGRTVFGADVGLFFKNRSKLARAAVALTRAFFYQSASLGEVSLFLLSTFGVELSEHDANWAKKIKKESNDNLLGFFSGSKDQFEKNTCTHPYASKVTILVFKHFYYTFLNYFCSGTAFVYRRSAVRH